MRTKRPEQEGAAGIARKGLPNGITIQHLYKCANTLGVVAAPFGCSREYPDKTWNVMRLNPDQSSF